ncbi:hypothetical protein BC833DRAFT_592625 [Globomyces pollinis-pini]|nr:hypothetical protein BC833DRAFT_592625 [Globomyces pollinis-pini]
MSWNNDARNREQQDRLIETQTDGLADTLHDKVSKIKQITLQMQGSLDEEHIMLDDMGSSFDNISDDIKRTGKKLALVMDTPHGRRMLMIVGGFVVIFLLYWLTRAS